MDTRVRQRWERLVDVESISPDDEDLDKRWGERHGPCTIAATLRSASAVVFAFTRSLTSDQCHYETSLLTSLVHYITDNEALRTKTVPLLYHTNTRELRNFNCRLPLHQAAALDPSPAGAEAIARRILQVARQNGDRRLTDSPLSRRCNMCSHLQEFYYTCKARTGTAVVCEDPLLFVPLARGMCRRLAVDLWIQMASNQVSSITLDFEKDLDKLVECQDFDKEVLNFLQRHGPSVLSEEQTKTMISALDPFGGIQEVARQSHGLRYSLGEARYINDAIRVLITAVETHFQDDLLCHQSNPDQLATLIPYQDICSRLETMKDWELLPYSKAADLITSIVTTAKGPHACRINSGTATEAIRKLLNKESFQFSKATRRRLRAIKSIVEFAEKQHTGGDGEQPPSSAMNFHKCDICQLLLAFVDIQKEQGQN